MPPPAPNVIVLAGPNGAGKTTASETLFVGDYAVPHYVNADTIARGLSLVAIVLAGLTFAFGEGGSKRVLAGVLFGVGMAIAAVNFLSWLFPGS